MLSLFTLPLLYRVFPPTIEGEIDPSNGPPDMSRAGVVVVLFVTSLALASPARAQTPPPAPAPNAVVLPDVGSGAPSTAVPSSTAVEESLLVTPPLVGGPTEDELLERWLSKSREVEYLRSAIGAARFDVVQARLWPNLGFAILPSGVLNGVPPDGMFNFGTQLNAQIPTGQVRARANVAESVLRAVELDVLTALWERATELQRAMRDRAFAEARVRDLHATSRGARTGPAHRHGARDGRCELAIRRAPRRCFGGDVSRGVDRGDDRARALRGRAPRASLRPDPRGRGDHARGSRGVPRPRGRGGARAVRPRRIVPNLELARRGALSRDALAARWRRENRPVPNLFFGTYLTRGAASISLVGGVEIMLPTFDRNQGNIGRARTEAEAQRALAAALEVRVRMEVTTAFRARAAARTALAEYRARGLGTRAEMLQRAEVAFESGRFSIAELLDAYMALWEGRAQELDLERELADSEVDLERAAALVAFGRPDAAEPVGPQAAGSVR